MNSDLRFRPMTQADLPFADSLRAMAGWNQTAQDWQRLLSYQPHGCFIAEWDGFPVGTATTTRYGAELAWIGMLLVHPEYRRRGVGRALLEHCLNHLRGTPCIKLDATPLGKQLYDKLGFQVEWPLTRWECKWFGGSAESRLTEASRSAQSPNPGGGWPEFVNDRSALSFGDSGSTIHASVSIKPWSDSAAVQLDHLDSLVFGISRAAMLERLAAGSSVALVAASAAGDMSGYGLLREGAKAVYLGPVVAATPGAGVELLKALLDHTKGKPVYWDVPDANATAVSLVQESGFIPQRHLLRMYLGQNERAGNASNYYAIADPAIG